jgi:hypothetical protein
VGETPVERFLARKTEDVRESGPDVSRSSLQRQRSLEGYFDAGVPPRWMERLAEIEQLTRRARRDLEAAYRAMRDEVPPERFAERWQTVAERWRFDEVNELIAQHNEWFPIERRLPVDLRTRDYVLIHGRSYRRRELGPDWILEQFPAR